MTSTSFDASILSESTLPRVRIAVLGGGVAGVTLASELARSEAADVTVIEKDRVLGGLHRSTQLDGCTYDIGTFLFSSDHELFKTFPEIERGFRPVEVECVAIRKPGSIDRYPLSLSGYMQDFGVAETVHSIVDLLLHRLKRTKPSTLPEHICRYIGSRFYVNSGLKHYIERLYHMDDASIDVLFAKQRIDMLESHVSLKNVLRGLRARLHRPMGEARGSVCRVRPAGGFSEVYGAIRRSLDREGARVLTGTEIQSIAKVYDGFAIRFGGRVEWFDRVVSTIPIPTLASYLGMNLDARFDYMKLVSLFYRFRGDAGFTPSVLFNYSPGGGWKRVTRFSEFYGRHEGDEYFTVEATSLDSSEEAVSRLCEDFERHARELGLFRGMLWCQGHTVTEHAYPLFHHDELRKLDEARRRIRALGVDLVGRQGNFEYISSVQTALKAKALARGLRVEAAAVSG